MKTEPKLSGGNIPLSFKMKRMSDLVQITEYMCVCYGIFGFIYYFFISKNTPMAQEYFLRKALAKIELPRIIMENPIPFLIDEYEKDHADWPDEDQHSILAANAYLRTAPDLTDTTNRFLGRMKAISKDPVYDELFSDTASFKKEMEKDVDKENYNRKSAIIEYKIEGKRTDPDGILKFFLEKEKKDRKFYFRKDVMIRMPNLHWIFDQKIREYVDSMYSENFNNQTRKSKAYWKKIISLIDEVSDSIDRFYLNLREVRSFISSLEKKPYNFLNASELYQSLQDSIDIIIEDYENPKKGCINVIHDLCRTRFLSSAMRSHNYISDWFETGFFEHYEKCFKGLKNSSPSLESAINEAKRSWDSEFEEKFREKNSALKESDLDQTIQSYKYNRSEKILSGLRSRLTANRSRLTIKNNKETEEIEKILRDKIPLIAKNYDLEGELTGYLYKILRNVLNPANPYLKHSDAIGHTDEDYFDELFPYGTSYDAAELKDLPLELVLLGSFKRIPKVEKANQLHYQRYKGRNYRCRECYKVYYSDPSGLFGKNCPICPVRTNTTVHADSILLPLLSFVQNAEIEDIRQHNRGEVVLYHPSISDLLVRYLDYYNTLLPPRTQSIHFQLGYKFSFLTNCFPYSKSKLEKVHFTKKKERKYLENTLTKTNKSLNALLFDFTFRLVELGDAIPEEDQPAFDELYDEFVPTTNELCGLQKEKITRKVIENIRRLVEKQIRLRRKVVKLLPSDELGNQMKKHEDLYWKLIDVFHMFTEGDTFEYDNVQRLMNLMLLERK